MCDSVTATTTTTTTGITTTEGVVFTSESTTTPDPFEFETTTPTESDSSTTPTATSLERAHWCRFNNGSYLTLGQTFMYTECALCQCTQSRIIRCITLQCMPTYCIDNSVPSHRAGQCCSQCAYEGPPTSCVQNGITFPHGTVLKVTGDKLQCWCQFGSIECRKSSASVFSSWDLWGEGTAVYIVVIVVCVLLLLGTLLCCGCSIIYYYYYKRNQASIQQAYEEYCNSAGWQPMTEEENFDASAQEKQAEAEQNQYEYEYPTGNSKEYVPPPYALYNGPYEPEKDERI